MPPVSEGDWLGMKLPFFVRALESDGDVLAADLRSKPRALLDLWLRWRKADGGAAVPRKTAIDPVDLASAQLMPDVWLIGLQEDGRFRFSLSGENTNALFNTSLRGKTVEETFDAETAAFANHRYDRIIREERIEFSRGPVTCEGRPAYYAHRLILPLRSENGTSSFAIGVAETEELRPYPDRNVQHQFFFDEIILTKADRLTSS